MSWSQTFEEMGCEASGQVAQLEDAPAVRAWPLATPNSPSVKILIVDDEPSIREILAHWLTSAGYHCSVAASAEEAWSLLKQEKFSLVVADLLMSGETGLELLNRIKKRFAEEVALIMITGVAERSSAIRALELGAYSFMSKPVAENEVLINIINALERRRLVLASQKYEYNLEKKVRLQTEEIRNSREEIALRLIAAQEYRHDEAGAHVRCVGLIAEALSLSCGHAKEYAEMLRLATPMHDVGKIGIPDSILMKPGKLSIGEFEIMKTHTLIGSNILAGTSIPMLNIAKEIAQSHHERWDGSGYPEGLAGEEIPESARIAALADVYDALLRDRVYRPAKSEKEALALMKQKRGTHFDPRIYDIFKTMLPELRAIRRQVEEQNR